jgi:hypothetical protein
MSQWKIKRQKRESQKRESQKRESQKRESKEGESKEGETLRVAVAVVQLQRFRREVVRF